MKNYYPYDPQHPKEVLGEIHIVTDGAILLDHIPFRNSIEIDGFVQTDSTTLLRGQFRCNYADETFYREANCQVYFNQIHNGQRVVVNYLQVGTIIIADDLNEIKAHMEDERLHQLYELPTASALQKGGIRPGNGLTMIGDLLTVTLASGASSVDVAEHNDSSAAHPYIQNLLGDEIAARIQAVADLERRIESLELRLGGGLMFDSDGVLQLKLGEGLALDADGFLNVTVAAAVNDDPAVWLKSQQLGVETDTDNSLAECAAHWNLEAVTYDYQVLRFNDTYAAIALPAVFANRSYGSDYKFFYPPDNDVLYNCADRYVEGSDFGGLIEIPASEVAVSECQPTHHHWVTISQSICNALKWYSEDAGAYNTDFFLFVKE